MIIEVRIDLVVPRPNRPTIYSVNEHGVPLGQEIKKGDLLLMRDRETTPRFEPFVGRVTDAEPMLMLHIDERTGRSAKGWGFLVEKVDTL